jgi:hypothetical protein
VKISGSFRIQRPPGWRVLTLSSGPASASRFEGLVSDCARPGS